MLAQASVRGQLLASTSQSEKILRSFVKSKNGDTFLVGVSGAKPLTDTMYYFEPESIVRGCVNLFYNTHMTITLHRYTDKKFSLDEVKTLFREYNDVLQIDLVFQDFEAEFKNLPGKYDPKNNGQLYWLTYNGESAGCAGFYQYEEGTCEIKRVYVRSKFQGKKLGQLIMETAIDDAKKLGYKTMILDSLGRLTTAKQLYLKLGFTEIEPYNINPHEDVYYMALQL